MTRKDKLRGVVYVRCEKTGARQRDSFNNGTNMAKNDSTVGLPSADNEDYQVPGQRMNQFCQPCTKNGKETAAAVFCSDCNEFQCTECSNGHNIYSFMKNHTLVDANTARKLPVPYDMKGLDKCTKHDELVKFFCKDHENLCCSTCAIIEHRKCNHVDEIKNMTVDADEKEHALKMKVNEMKVRGEAAVKCWTDGERMMHTQLQNVFEHLTAIRTSVNKKLDEVEYAIKQQGSSLSELKAKEYARNLLDCEGTVDDLKRNLALLDDIKRNGGQEQQFIAQQRVKESLEGMSDKASSEWSKLEKIDISLQINPNLEALLDSTEKLASLKTNTSKVTIDSIVEGMPVKLKKIASIDLQQSENETGDLFYTGIDFLPDGRLVVVDNKNDKCIILNDQLERLGLYKLSNTPRDLVTVSEDRVAVTCVGTIAFLHVSRSNEITEIKTVKTTPNCYSISVKGDDHFVVGVYDDANPVRVISFSGEEEHLNIDFPDKKFGVVDSSCTYIQNSDKVVLTDRYEHTVYIYYMKDKTRVIVKDEQIMEPRGVAVGPFDSIFVCSKGTNSIVQISQTGTVLSSHKLDMVYPFRVCVSKDKTKLAVSNSACGKFKLQLFCLEF